jgi:hypothetical protein
MKNYVIGIDVGIEKLDFYLQRGETILEEFIAENTTDTIKMTKPSACKTSHFSFCKAERCYFSPAKSETNAINLRKIVSRHCERSEAIQLKHTL